MTEKSSISSLGGSTFRKINQSGDSTKGSQVEVLSITHVENRGSLRAFVNIRIGDLLIYDCRIIQENGKKAWVSMPVLTYNVQDGKPKYKPSVQITDEKLKNEISEAVLKAWENYIGGNIWI